MPATVNVLLAALRERGGRITPGRRVIVEELVGAGGHGHVTADDLVAAVQARHPDVHLSTVYRTLETLEEAGLVRHVHFGHGAAYWHLTTDDEHHLVCEGCGGVIHVPAELFFGLQDELRRRYGFEVSLRHFATPGLCPACRSPGSAAGAGAGSGLGALAVRAPADQAARDVSDARG